MKKAHCPFGAALLLCVLGRDEGSAAATRLDSSQPYSPTLAQIR
jgi:hypothetical protein